MFEVTVNFIGGLTTSYQVNKDTEFEIVQWIKGHNPNEICEFFANNSRVVLCRRGIAMIQSQEVIL